MPKYIVRLPEVHTQKIEVEANNAEEAREMVLDGQGEEIGPPEYDYALDDTGLLDVEEVKQ